MKRSADYVGLAFVALCTMASLTALRVGDKVLKIFDDMKVNLPWPTWIAVHGRTPLFALVYSIPIVALIAHRHERTQGFMAVLGALQLLIAAEYVFALWLVVRDMCLPMAT